MNTMIAVYVERLRGARAKLACGLMAGLLLAPQAVFAEEAAHWQVDKEESRLGFVARQSGAEFEGEFTDWDADIRFDPDRLSESVVTVSVNMASATTFSKDRDGLLVESEWFDTTSYPEAVWKSTSFRKTGGDSYVAPGTLTMKGASHPVEMRFDLKIEGDKASLVGDATLDRRDWAVGSGSWSTDKIVGHGVTVKVDLKADRLPEAAEER